MSDDNNMDEGLMALEVTTNRLITAVTDVSKRLNTTERMQAELQKQQDQIRKQQRRIEAQRGINIWLGLSLCLDIVLSVVIGLGFIRIDHNADSINRIQERTSEEVLCPLYEVFVRAVRNPRPEQVNTPKKKEEFKKNAKVIEDGFKALGCA